MTLLKRLLKIVLVGLGALAVFLAVVAGITQTQMFRDRLRAAALSSLDSILDADVRLGSLTGNLVTGFSIHGVSISVSGRELLSAQRLDLQYDLWGLPGKQVAIDNVTLIHPTLCLERDRSGIWNFRRAIRATPADTGVGRPFNWLLTLRRLTIQGGTFSLVDSVALARADHATRDSSFVEYHDVALHDVGLVLSAKISRAMKEVVIEKLACISDRPGIELKRLSAGIMVTPQETRVDNLEIYTARSAVTLSAQIKNFNLFGGVSLEGLRRKPVALDLRAQDIDLDELKQFIPQIDFLHGSAGVALEAMGEFGNLNIGRLDLRTRQTHLAMKGAVVNLHDPANLRLSCKLVGGKIVPADPAALMPAFDLPDLSSIGPASLDMEFEGTPLDFTTKFLVRSQCGVVESDAFALKIGGPRSLAYHGDIHFHELNLGGIIGKEGLASRLTGDVRIRGEGVSLGTLSSRFIVAVDSSSFLGQPVSASELSIDAHDRAMFCSARVSVSKMKSVLTASLNQQDGGLPRFTIDGSVSSLNLEDFLHRPASNSDLTMKIKAAGSGLSLSNLSGDFLVDLSSSRYGDYSITSGDLHLLLDQHDPKSRRLNITSNVADFSLTGAFELSSLMRLMSFEWENVRDAVAARVASFHAPLQIPSQSGTVAVVGTLRPDDTSSVDARFRLVVKDLEPISIVTGDKTFNGTGILNGRVHGTRKNLSLDSDLSIGEFYYGTVEGGVFIQDADLTIALENLRPQRPLMGGKLQMKVSAGRVHVNSNELDSLSADLQYDREAARFKLRTDANHDLRFAVGGNGIVTDDSIACRFDQLDAAFQGNAWHADDGAEIRLTGHGLDIAHLVMRQDTQMVSLEGSLGQGGLLRARLEADRLDLDGLKNLLSEEELGQSQEAFHGSARLTATAGGTLENPELWLKLQAQDLSFRGVPFGRVAMECSYRDTVLDVNCSVDNTSDGTPELLIEGTLPVNLSFSAVDVRVPDRPIDLTIRSQGVQINILDPLLPTLNDLTGIMRCDLRVGGSLRKPDYGGSIALDDCAFLFVPNNIRYVFKGAFEASGERIKVLSATVGNVPGDESEKRRGNLHVTGDFSLRDLQPGDFNFTGIGDLLVVKESTWKSSLSVYGNLFVEIGTGGLRFTGSIDNSLLKGRLLIRNSSLVFPPTQAAVKDEAALSVPVKFVDDTARSAAPRPPSALARFLGDSGATHGSQVPGELAHQGKSFMDGVHYDLDIETSGGNTEIQMIFNPITGEELVATINGKFSITEDGRRWVGDLSIERAYYNFLKRFDADGKIRFTGDFLNPELDIRARYQGTRVVRDSTSERNETVVVTFKITGTRYEPRIEPSMTINDVDYVSYRGPKSNDVQSDAIQFIVYGSFPLTAAQKNEIPTDVQKTVGLSLLTGATSMLTGTLSEFLRAQTGFINSVELSYGSQGSLSSSADIRVSGVIWNGYWRYGGRILDDPLSNANFSLMYSFDTIFGDPSLRNLMFELERKVEANTIGGTNELKRVNSARLFYRFSF